MAEILVVEEDKKIGDSIVEALEAKGHRTARASDGLEALGKIYAREYDLVVLDVRLAGIDGSGLVEALKKRTPGTLAIMVGTRSDLERVNEALRRGAYDFIVKPHIEDKLIPAVEDALRDARQMRKSGYAYKDNREGGRSLIVRRGILTGLDSLLAGSAFLFSFAICTYVLRILPSDLSIPLANITRLSLGIAFCYAFTSVFRQSYRYERGDFGKIPLGQIWRDITVAYSAFIGILFMSGNLQILSGRVGVLAGYGLGFLAIIFSRNIVIPFLNARLRREGRKKIVIIGSSRREMPDAPLTFGRLDSMNPGLTRDRDRQAKDDREAEPTPVRRTTDWEAFSDDTDEIRIDAGTLSASDVLSLVDRHRRRRLEVMTRKTPSPIPDEDDLGK